MTIGKAVRRVSTIVALAALLAAVAPAQEAGKSDMGERRVIKPEASAFRGMREGWAASDLVILGRVVDERAELSADKSTVWTHYTVEVLQVFKRTGSGPQPNAVSLAVEGGDVAERERSYSVVNEMFPRLPWVREHVFFLVRKDGGYQLLGGAQGVFRHDEQDLMRCHLPKSAWGFLCRSRDGTKWADLLKDMKEKY